jgi:hypothetical protein
MQITSGKVLSGANTPTKIPGGDLRLPDGRRVDDVKPGELAAILIAAGVEGVTHEQGKNVTAQAYSDHLAKIRTAAGDRAEAEWREQHRPKLQPGD